MSELASELVVALVASLFGYFVAWRLKKPIRLDTAGNESKAGQATARDHGLSAQLELQFEKGKAEGAFVALTNYKSSEDIAALLSIAHSKGRIAGSAEERERFHIIYTPILIDHESFLSHKVDAGYDMQIYYSGFPIGEPTRRITSHQESSKDENVSKLLEVIGGVVQLTASAAIKQNIPVTIQKVPKRMPKK